MSARSRLITFGAAGAAAVAGIVCAVLSTGVAAQIVAIVLISVGFGGAVLLVFYEVGLSEDHARAREEADRRRREEADRRRREEAEQRRDPKLGRGGRSRRPWWARRPG